MIRFFSYVLTAFSFTFRDVQRLSSTGRYKKNMRSNAIILSTNFPVFMDALFYRYSEK